MDSVLQIGQISFKIQVKTFCLKWSNPSFDTKLAVAGFSLILERARISVFRDSHFQSDINKKATVAQNNFMNWSYSLPKYVFEIHFLFYFIMERCCLHSSVSLTNSWELLQESCWWNVILQETLKIWLRFKVFLSCQF